MARIRHVTVPDLKPDEWADIAVGTVLMDTLPELRRRPVLCLNGAFLMRKDWPLTVAAEHDVEWYVDQPGDREEFRTILQVAVIVASIFAPYLAPYLAALSVAYNLLVPPTVLDQINDTGTVYNASLSGNQARIDQPILRIMGIDNLTPPFAAQPYFYFDSKGDQYYNVLLCLGYGPVDILAKFIGKTPISSFADVIVNNYLPPGVSPTTVKGNVLTSREVNGLELTTGRYCGGFVVCKPGQKVSAIGWDVVAPQGLGRLASEDDSRTEVTVKWQIEYQEINDAGSPIGPWKILTAQERTAATNVPLRWSGEQNLDAPARVQVRNARANLPNTDPQARDTITWAGLRGILENPAPLNPNVSHFEIVLRASQQLSQSSQTDFRIIAQGKCRTWHPDTGWNCAIGDWDNYVATRNPAWWLAEVWSDTGTGEGLPDERIDLQGLYDLAQTWDARQDRFDYTFLDRMDVWSVSQLIASAGRARVFRRYGVRTLARDELATLGKIAITPRTVVEGSSLPMTEKLPRGTDADGFVIEYQSNVSWTTAQVECPCPGVSTMVRPVYQRYEGIKGYYQAKREGLYHAADLALRQRVTNAKTEMQATLGAYLLPVKWMPEQAIYGQAGDVAYWDADILVMSLSEKPDFRQAPIYLTLRRDDGSLTEAVPVLPGPTDWDVTLPAAPDFELVLDADDRERPVFLLGPLDGDEIVKISAIKDGGRGKNGAQFYDVEAIVDDPRVHRVDIPYLPGPGDVQDPVGVPGDVPGGGTLVLVTLQDHEVQDGQTVSGGALGAGFSLNPDGTLDLIRVRNDGPNPPQRVPGEWLLVPVEPAVASQFEVYFSKADTLIGDTGTFDTWLNLGTAQGCILGGDNFYPGRPVSVQIRRVGETVLQASRTMYLVCRTSDLH